MEILVKLAEYSYHYVILMAVAVGGVLVGSKLRKAKDAK